MFGEVKTVNLNFSSSRFWTTKSGTFVSRSSTGRTSNFHDHPLQKKSTSRGSFFWSYIAPSTRPHRVFRCFSYWANIPKNIPLTSNASKVSYIQDGLPQLYKSRQRPSAKSWNPGASIYLEGKSLHLMWGSTTNSPAKTTKIQSWNNRLPLSQHPLTRNWHRQRTNSPSKTTPKLSTIVGVLFVLFEKSIYLRIESCKLFNGTFFWTLISPMAWKQYISNKILEQKCGIYPNQPGGLTITHNRIFPSKVDKESPKKSKPKGNFAFLRG